MEVLHSAQILGGFVDSTCLGIIAQDSTGQIRLWNPGAQRILGWCGEDVLNRPTPAALQLLFNAQGQFEASLPTKDGPAVDVEVWRGNWKDASVNEQGVIAVITRIADRLDLQRKLASVERELFAVTVREHETRAEMQTERRFRELLEAAPDAIIEVDRDGRIVLLNLVTEKSFGYTREELLGQPVEVLLPDALKAGHANHRAHYWNQPVTRPMGHALALRGRRKDGSSFPVEISLSPVKSEDGFRVTAIIRDISDRKQAEDRFREMQQAYMHELESRNREVERANQLNREFLASMSHELRTPLHTVIGFAELLAEELEGPLNEKQHRFIDHIHKDSLHLLELINDILDISKIESGRLELRREVFDLGGALEETLSTIRPQAQAKSIDIGTSLHIPGAIFADRLRVKQILFNLLSNAVKFTPEGGSVRVDGMRHDSFVEISISDTGIGIPAEQQEAVFDKFYQVGATTKGVREGTGLGLAITKSLVEEHGGRVSVQSTPGKGSRFTFTIALEQEYDARV